MTRLHTLADATHYKDIKKDLHALQPNKQRLVRNQRPAIPLSQLHQPIRTPRRNQHNRQRHETKKQPQPRPKRRTRTRSSRSGPEVPREVVGEEGAEDEHGGDLQAEADEGHVDADLACAG